MHSSEGIPGRKTRFLRGLEGAKGGDPHGWVLRSHPGGGWVDKQTGCQLTGLGGPGLEWQEQGKEEQEPPGVQEGPGGSGEPPSGSREEGLRSRADAGGGVTCPRPLCQHPCLGPFTSCGSVSTASLLCPACAVLSGCFPRTQEPYMPSELLEAAELALRGHTPC